MACPKCGCKVCYTYDDDDQNDELERCAACGEIFSEHDAAPDEDDFGPDENMAMNDDPGM